MLNSFKEIESELIDLVSESTDLIYILDGSGKFQYINNTFQAITGYLEKDIKGKSLWDLVKEPNKQEVLALFQESIAALVKNTYHEFPLSTKANTEIWIGQNTSFSYENKKPKSIKAIARNISESRSKEKSLKESKYYLDLIEDTMAIGSWEYDLRTDKLSSSKEVYNIHGFSINNKPDLDTAINFYDEESVPIIKEALKKCINHGISYDLKLGINTPQGTHKWVRTVGTAKMAGGQVVKLRGIFQDITKDKEAELKLDHFYLGLKHINHIAANASLDLDEQLSMALKIITEYMKMPIGIISKISGDTYEVKYIECQEEGVNISKNDIFELSDTYCVITFDEQRVVALSKVKNSKYAKHPCYKTLRLESYIASPIWVNNKVYGTINFSSRQPRLETFGKHEKEFISLFSKWLGSVIEREMVRREIIEARDRAERASAAKAEFLSIMSHEIRTPLNAVIGMSQLLLQESPADHQIENLNTLKFSAENLLFLVNDILDYNKIESGKISFEETTFDLIQLIKGIRQSLLVEARKKGLSIRVILDTDLPTYVMGDPSRLGQVLLNLTSNAIKFTEKGGIKIILEIVKESKQGIIINFKVKDSGIGIAKDKISLIFDKFTQASMDTTRKFGGTGLGLAITKKLLELQKSQIKVESTQGKGTSFFFDLSFKKSKKVMKQKATDNSPKLNTTGMKLLIVEDNEINKIILSKFLSKWNMEIENANDGQEALEMVRKNTYDLVLMDLQMPVMDGYEATEAIRALEGENYKNLPIIALTASATKNIKEKALKSGMNDYLTKPFKPTDLYEKISKYVVTND